MVPYKTLIAQTIKVCDSMEIYNISSDYVMFRPVRTMAQARQGLLSVVILPCGVGGIDSWSLLTFGGGKSCIRT